MPKILISNWKNPRIFFTFLFFSRTFPGLEIYFSIFKVFQAAWGPYLSYFQHK